MGALVIVLGVALLSWGLFDLWGEIAGSRRYEELASETVADIPLSDEGGGPTQQVAAGRDWEKVREWADNVAAWVTVANTNIDYPVMDPSGKPDGYYLRHDLWGERDPVGTPFLDLGSTATGAHSLSYAHHLATTGTMYSAVSQTFDQGEFDGLGEMTWETPTGRTTLRPLCALKVDEHYMPIRKFTFTGTRDLEAWLTGIVAVADARSADADALVKSAGKVVTLVTCSSMRANQPWRTLTVFVGEGAADGSGHDSVADGSVPVTGDVKDGSGDAA